MSLPPDDLLIEYVLGLLPPAQMAEMDRLASVSGELRGAADEIRCALASVASSLPPVQPSRQVRARLLDDMASLPNGSQPAVRPSRPRALAPGAPPPVRVLLDEHSRPEGQSWRRNAGQAVALVVGLAVLGSVALIASTGSTGATLATRAPALLLLVLAQIAGIWAALSPGRSRLAPVSWAAAATGAALALTGHAGAISDAPGWTCTIIQLSGGLAALTLVLRALRGLPWSWHRAITAGVALGTAGALWGEIECHRSSLHVATHHGGTWLVLLAACVWLSWLRRERSLG